MRSNASKPYQCRLIEAHGFKVPETLITTDASAARWFRDQHREVVYKSIRSRVVLPNIGHVDEHTRGTARRLVSEMDEPGALASSALPALLYVTPEDAEEVASKLGDRVNDNDAERVGAVALGVSAWLQHAAADGTSPPLRKTFSIS